MRWEFSKLSKLIETRESLPHGGDNQANIKLGMPIGFIPTATMDSGLATKSLPPEPQDADIVGVIPIGMKLGNNMSSNFPSKTLFFNALIVLVLICGALLYYLVERLHLTREKTQELAAVAELKSTHIQQWKRDHESVMERAAKNPKALAPLANILKDPADQHYWKQLRDYLISKPKLGPIGDIKFYLNDGQFFCANNKGAVSSDATEAVVKEALASKSPVFSKFISAKNGVIYVDLASVVGVPGDKSLGVLVLSYDVMQFFDPVIQESGFGESAEAVLGERDGEDALFLDQTRKNGATSLSFHRKPIKDSDISIVQAIKGLEGSFKAKDNRAVEVLSYCLPIAGSPWIIEAKINRSKIQTEVLHHTMVFGFCILAVIFVIGLRSFVSLGKNKEDISNKNSLLEKILDVSTSGYLIVDPEGRTLAQNQQFLRLFDIAPDNPKLMDFSERVNWIAPQTKNPSDFIESTFRLMELPTEIGVDELHLKKGLIVRRYSTPFVDGNGKVLGRIWIFNDCTEERQKQILLQESTEKALSSDRAKSTFLAVMSHELRTPLNGILGYTHILLQDPNLSEESLEKIKVIASSGQSLLRLLDDILAYTQLEGGRIKIRNEPFSIAELSKSVIGIVEPDANAKSLNLRLNLGANLPPFLNGDAHRIGQVLLNLLRNAVKFTDGGEVSLSIEPVVVNGIAEHVRFAVKDTGPGIPDDQKEIIFQPFTQGDSTFARRFEGVGLGLAISKNLVETMGSSLELESQVGKGSIFFFQLSLSPLPNTTSESLERASWETTYNSRRAENLDEGFARKFPARILVVEDHPMNLNMAVILLKRLGYKTILTANDGEEGVRVFMQEKVNVIFMDLQMPKLSGIAATEQIRAWESANPSARPATIIALTANASTTGRNQCFHAYRDDTHNVCILGFWRQRFRR